MESKSIHEKYMDMCLHLAEKGKGYTSPNPMVGCVIVKNGKVVGRGYHEKYGGPHAEVNALTRAGKLAERSTLYVNLEPCSHFGKTPPCVDLIISKKVKRVVIGMRDPNPVVNGSGVKKLREAKIEVIENILIRRAKLLNEKFIKSVGQKMPFVTVKIAQTLDGRIADSQFKSKWITNSLAQKYTHGLRATNDAILVGANTIIKDNPKLTVRLLKGRNPVRVVVDGKLSTPLSSEVFRNTNVAKTVIFISKKIVRTKHSKINALTKLGIDVVALKSNSYRISLNQVLKMLHLMNITSVLVEGGSNIFSQIIVKNLADKIVFMVAPKILGDGIQSIKLNKNIPLQKALSLKNLKIKILNDNVIFEGYINYKG
jgi:diaminohydroxyphosphoribosylaminopyrimidine deaminase / 5-amino-6-(5-phosphoribosylamino)uracil reductase